MSEPPGETYPAPTWEYVDLGGRYTTGESAYETAARTGEAVYGVRHAIAFPDGTRRLIAADAAPVSEGRETEYVVVAVADVTDSETERARAERHRVLVEHADDAMAVLEDGRYRLVNEACGDLLGVSPEAAVGSTDRDLLPSDVASALADHSERAVEAGAAVSQRVEVVCGERTRTFEVLHVPRESVVGADTSVARVCREVSEQAERERLLREERDRLESLAGAVAHDARNAIRSSRGGPTSRARRPPPATRRCGGTSTRSTAASNACSSWWPPWSRSGA
ncbi:PAS domain-containing protein [Halobaculum litoreum]|uniref:PAS domain-containing protein n=1 Tax=Halobaculum litoreum TaxID=3031998 RepID=A0ABD5XU90_9EURY